MSEKIKMVRILCIVIGGITIITTVALISFGVWLPDLLLRQENVLEIAKFSHNYEVRIIQVWDSDFYKTIGRLSKPDGTTQDFLLDTDGFKLWNCQCEVHLSESNMQVKVIQKSSQGLWRQTVEYQWSTGENRLIKPGDERT